MGVFPDPSRSGLSKRCVDLFCVLDPCEVIVLDEPGFSTFAAICTLCGLDNCELVVLEDPALSRRVREVGPSTQFNVSDLGAFADPGRSNRLTLTAWVRVGLATGLDSFDGDSEGIGCGRSGTGAEVSAGGADTGDWGAGAWAS